MSEGQELRREVRVLRNENAVLRRRIGVLELTIDTLKAERQETRFFTSEQVAGFLQVSVQTVQGYIRSGKLKAIKPEKGGQFRVSHKALNDFILKSTVEVIEVCEC
nr:MAG TPA: helix-turn-helix domain protein [Caudoviricetes sp.]